MSQELKACPFCGSAAEMRASGSIHSIRCTGSDCGGQVNVLVSNEGPHARTKREAIRVWNRRYQSPVVEPGVGEAREQPRKELQ